MRNYIAIFFKNNLYYLIKLSTSKTGVFFKKLRDLQKVLKLALIENRLLVYISIFYYLLTFVIGSFYGKSITGDLDFYYITLYIMIFSFFFLMWSSTTILELIKNRKKGFSEIPFIWVKLKKQYLSLSTIIRFFIFSTILPLFMCSYISIKQAIPIFKMFSADNLLFRLDRALHFNFSPWEILQPIVGYPVITKFIDSCYLAWGSIFIYSMLFMACHSNKHLRLRFFISLAFCWIIIGNIFAVILSSAGPCYFTESTGSSTNPYEPLFEYLRHIPNLKAVAIQSALWKAFQANVFMPLGGISAMPSMHVSVAVLLALLYRHFGRVQGWIMIVFAVIIQIGSVHLGWHYAVDGYLSASLTLIIWKVSGLFCGPKHFPIKRKPSEKYLGAPEWGE